MDGDAGLPPAPLQVETQLEPGELTSARAGPGFGVCNVHIFAIPDHEGVAKTLGDVGSAVGAEAEPFFRDKDELVCPREPLGGSSGAGRRVARARQIVGLKMSWFTPGSRSVEAAVPGGGSRGRARSSDSAKKMVPTLWSSDGAMTS